MRSSSILFALALLGCSGDASSTSTVGAAGGTVASGGAEVVIPPGALAQDTPIAVAQSSDGAPALPAGVAAAGPMFAFTPHGTSFVAPVTIAVPFDPASVPAGESATLYKTNATMTGWDAVPGATVAGATLSGHVTGFSFAVAARPSAPTPELTEKIWALDGWNVSDDLDDEDLLDQGDQIPGVVDRTASYGAPLPIPTPGRDDPHARLGVFVNGSGSTYWTTAEAPATDLDDPKHLNGGASVLYLVSTYKKTEENASLRIVLSGVTLDATDDGGAAPGPDACPWLAPDASDAEIHECLELMTLAQSAFGVTAHVLLQPDDFFSAGSDVTLTGGGGQWEAGTEPLADNNIVGSLAFVGAYEEPVWNDGDFDFDFDVAGNGGRQARVQLEGKKVIDVPLSAVAVGQVFNVEILAMTTTVNVLQGESYVAAFLRDPQETEGLTTSFTGLEQVPVVHDQRPAPTPQPCTTAPPPDAGTVQFTAPDSRFPERHPGARVFVERTGGTRGDVSVLVESDGGTATPGSDYVSVHSIVRFRDGEGGRRAVSVPLVYDRIPEPDETVGLKLTMFGGCAAVGAQSAATVTILDDDRAVSTPTFTVGGTVSGLAGTGLLLRDAGGSGSVTPVNGPFVFPAARPDGSAYDVRIDAQPQNPLQICSVSDGKGRIAGANVADVEVTCTTPENTGGLDATFGSAGKLTGPLAQAQALALQPDGKLVVVGAMTLSRYNADGSADLSFGTAGRVTVVANGGPVDEMLAIALQADGKIVVGGQTSTPPSGFNDMVILRYLPDGSLDTGFGTGGKVVNALGPTATAVLLQPDGKIVVAGAISRKLAAVRYLPDGSPDTGFGSGGTALSNTTAPFGPAAALQTDGSIVLAGSADDGAGSVAGFWVTRFGPDGALDLGFGDHGTFRLDGGVAFDVAIQPDGKIVVGGSVGIGGSFAYTLVRVTSGGGLDMGFGAQGMVTTPFSGKNDYGRAVALQPDGRIILAGEIADFGARDFGLARYLADGSLDTSFGTGGLLQIDFFGDFDSAYDVLVQPDGKIVAGGSAKNGFSGLFGVVRVLP